MMYTSDGISQCDNRQQMRVPHHQRQQQRRTLLQRSRHHGRRDHASRPIHPIAGGGLHTERCLTGTHDSIVQSKESTVSAVMAMMQTTDAEACMGLLGIRPAKVVH